MHEGIEHTEQLLQDDDRDGDHQTMRTFEIGLYETNKVRFCGNEVTTSSYSWYPGPRFFLYKNLKEQFQRYANRYFLVVAILQLIPDLSPTGKYTTGGPLLFVLLVSLAKEMYEDFERHTRDRKTNNQVAEIFRSGDWQSVRWRDICVGDIVKVEKETEFAADILLLHSSADKGLCHIETANLDGETNLKLRKAHVEPHDSPLPGFDPKHPESYQGRLACKPPDEDMYKFEGYMERSETTSSRKNRAHVTVDSILLRGARLGGGTSNIMGVVVYTGKDTKLMRNQKDCEKKKSQLERNTNKQIFRIFGLQLIFCFFCAVALAVVSADFKNHWYLAPRDLDSPAVSGFMGLGTFIILFNNLVPISLYVSMEVVKTVQARLIKTDIEMYYEEADMPAKADTSSLNEELGQVQYIFSDKTGTLTCNVMDFLKFSVGDTPYGTGTTEIGRAAAAREGHELHDDRPKNVKLVKGFYFYDKRISDEEGLGKHWNWMDQPNADELRYFFKVLAVCHTVVAEKNDCTEEIKYQAASPDENCLVNGAKYLGVEFVERTSEKIKIKVRQRNGSEELQIWTLLHVLEFNSDRKRMSVIVRDREQRLLLFCKGADTVIFDRLRKSLLPHERMLREKTKDFLTQFAKDGLRTLCIAQTELDEKEYLKWAPRYKKACENIGNRDQMVAEAAEEIEANLELLGTTAIEDKLQKGVPDTIELLRTAGINVWVLTGDKQETAINIGFACALLNNDMGVFKFSDDVNVSNITTTLQNYARDADSVRRDYGQELGMVVQGSTLKLILGDASDEVRPENKQHFLDIAKHCKVVICCRVTPGQKADVVRLVKQNLNEVTLAIGDGANDVSMIKEAHVGVGISGLEGLQAANAADYAIGQFRYLQRLLLVHGRWSYRRNSKLILYSFYKNICLYLTQFWFTLFNSFTGQSLYDSWSLTCYNVVFTLLPIVALAIFDRDVEPKRVIGDEKSAGTDQFPELYDDGRKNKLFNTRVFWAYTVNAIWHSAVCLFIPLTCMKNAADPANGWVMALPAQGLTGYTAVIFVVTLKCALEASSWTWITTLIFVGSLASWFAFLLVYCTLAIEFDTPLIWYLIYNDFQYPLVWLTVALSIAIALLRDFAWKAYKRNFEPSLAHIIQIWENKKRVGLVEDFDRRKLKNEAPKLFPRQMVKSYKKKDERPQKAVSDLRSQGQEQQQLDYLASMHLQAPWAVQYPNQYRQHPLGAPVTKHTHTYIT